MALSRAVGDECLIVPSVEGAGDLESVCILNETATVIYGLLDGENTLSEVASKVTDLYAVEPEVASRDLLALTDEMSEFGLVQSVGKADVGYMPTIGSGERPYVQPEASLLRVLEAGRAFYGALAKGCCSGAQRCPAS